MIHDYMNKKISVFDGPLSKEVCQSACFPITIPERQRICVFLRINQSATKNHNEIA
jgi:hypothetical protein